MVCDYTGISEKWINKFIIKENLEVVATVSPETTVIYFMELLKENSWEYLLIFEKNMRNEFEEFVKAFNLPKNRVIYALDENSWAENPAATYALLNPAKNTAIYRLTTFNIARQLNYFIAATTAEGLHYVATSRDDYIIPIAYVNRENHTDDSMKLFHELVKKFYDIDDSDGWFLDLGANIGMTGIYFTKILAPKLKLLAFEPDKENFKLLRANLILNDVENYVAENFGLGDVESEMSWYRDKLNPGHNGIFSGDTGIKSSKVKISPLDKYFVENKLNPKDVKYIWIDTEGFEPQVLLGAQNLLTENPAPIFMEFNPRAWNETNYFDKMINFLKKFYVGYIWIPQIFQTGEIEVEPIEKLLEFKDSTAKTGTLGDIFLIHKL